MTSLSLDYDSDLFLFLVEISAGGNRGGEGKWRGAACVTASARFKLIHNVYSAKNTLA